MCEMKDYNKEAQILIRTKMIERDVTFRDISETMCESTNKSDINRLSQVISRKVRRGTFSFAFGMQLLDMLNFKFKIEESK